MGGRTASATITSSPLARSASAAARPAGPPPTTNASVSYMGASPAQQNQLGAEARAHSGEQTDGSGLGSSFERGLLEHAEDGRRREISGPGQAAPRRIESAVGKLQRGLRRFENG